MGTFITNERAIIMIAHIHALTVSAAAAFGPQVSGRVGAGAGAGAGACVCAGEGEGEGKGKGAGEGW